MRAYGNNWHDAVMGEIELGSEGAYVAMAWDERFPSERNRDYDHGINGMTLWHLFEVDYLVETEGKSVEEAERLANDTPWGPWDWTEAMLDEDLESARRQVEHEEDLRLDAACRRRP